MSWRWIGNRSTIFVPRIYSPRTVPFAKCIYNPSNSHTYSTGSTQHRQSLPADELKEGQNVTISGLVRSVRKQKKVAFAHISDGTTLEPIQAILDPTLAKDITNGAYVELTGSWQASPGKGQAHELHVSGIDNLGHTETDEYPIQKKSQTADFLRSLPHLRMRTPLYSLLARTRSLLISGIHDFYSNTRPAGPAIQVQPPLITSSDCEGAGEVFTISPKSSKAISLAAGDQQQTTQHYFRDQKYLTVSSQLHLEAYAAELGDVWTLSPTFRAEESDTPRHLSEFYMLEAEFRGVTSLGTIMSEAQQLLQSLVRGLIESRVGRDLITYHSDPKYISADDTLRLNIEDRWNTVMTEIWPTLSYKDAIVFLQTHQDANPNHFVHTPNYDTGLQLEHERFLVSEFAHNVPLFITDYPKHIKPFYMLPSVASPDTTINEGDGTVACFDLLFPHGTAEIVGGSLREHRLPNLITAMRDKGLIKRKSTGEHVLPSDATDSTPFSAAFPGSPYPFLEASEALGPMQWYADLRRFGTSPHGGFGMGFDRLLAYVAGISNIRDTVGFPRYFGRADC